MRHARYQLGATRHAFRKYILRQKVPPLAPLYAWESVDGAKA